MNQKDKCVNFRCLEHGRVFEIICYQCSKLMCSRCSTTHIKETSHQNCDHIDDIRQSLNKILLENNTNNNNNNNNNSKDENNISCHIGERITTIWTIIKSSTEQYQRLSSTEKEISDHFHKLHEYLVVEEQKLKNPIIKDKDTINSHLIDNIRELRDLVDIIHLNGTDTRNDDTESNSDSDDNDSSTTALEDTTDRYSSAAIMKSISSSSTLNSFVKSNSDTLFNQCNQNNNRYTERLSFYDNEIDSLILDSVFKYSNQFKSLSAANQPNNNDSIVDYSLDTKEIDTTKFDELLNQSIKLSIKSPSPQSSSATTPTTTSISPNSKQTYIFAAHRSSGITLIDINNNYSFEEIHVGYDFTSTPNSTVVVGDYIYVFGSRSHKNRYLRYSISKKSFTLFEMKGINEGCWISACYDGRDHIYLVNSAGQARFDTFNINTQKFEKRPVLLDVPGTHVLSVFHKGMIYSIPMDRNSIVVYNPTKQSVEELYSSKLFKLTHSACTDGSGNIYLLSNDKRFIRINVETTDITNLSPISFYLDDYSSMTYHRVSEEECYIYLFGGEEYKNHIYSVQTNKWEEFHKDDIFSRSYCPSVVFEK
ncbi:hypothetical protein PPL_03835 [Heterostelium album PN500]|uniref:B box-type domain-containing protein n=1 Tax=Heterostelium pallidum (strain ATCC 26659 / Pp 5 / PN500) TaxID=670386 RepID=D3B6S8_HETP5|nr:hypothetical protein PPL_03835 [Heterostelium album PN500]EFA83048.1 hypothetical protein PPL_03835 [Heterostelium album PN500]|eukprot:XP_020435165.1 hypothetical protein PPL_03835 [Heterostelium album PN500]